MRNRVRQTYVDEVYFLADEVLAFGGVLYLVLRFAEDEPVHPGSSTRKARLFHINAEHKDDPS